MLKKGITFFLLSIFIVSTSIPTIISLVDTNTDISFLIDVNEEENTEKELSKDSETKIVHIRTTKLFHYGLELSDLTSFYLKNYARPYLNLVSPPPEQHIV